MPRINIACLLKNSDLAAKMRELIPILNLEVGARNGKPTFRQVRKALIDQTGVEIDMDSFAEMYKSEIPADLRFTTDAEIDSIVGASTKAAFEKLAVGAVDRIEGLGETSTDRAAINKAAAILTTIEGKDKSVKTRTLSKIIKDAVLGQIQRLANSNEDYKGLKNKDPKETFEQTMQRVLETNSLKAPQMEADKFNTIQDVMDQAKAAVLEHTKDLRDENGEFILGEEALNFLEQYKNAVVGVMMSTADANTLVRGALLEAGYGKGVAGKQVVDWKGLAGSINSPNVLRENVIAALQEGKGLSIEAATSIADSLSNEFADLVQGQKAMDVKYAIAESEAKKILDKLGRPPSQTLTNAINNALHEEIDKSVAESDELKIGEIVHDVMRDVAKISQSQLENLPNKALTITSHTADRIAKLVKGDGELDGNALAELYNTLGKVVDEEVINDLRRLSKLKEAIENVEIVVDESTGAVTLSKQGLEKAKLMQTISDQMARIVARSADYSDKSLFYKFTTHALNALSKFTSANAALVLLNPFNLTQNLLSGRFVHTQGRVGGAVAGLFTKNQTPLIYTTETGEKVDLTRLLNASGLYDTWWNTLLGAGGRDIPDLFTGDVSRDSKTFQTAETKGELVEAAFTSLPRAALTATDAMLKEPYFRGELIRGILYHLQASGGKTKQQAQNLVYEALTKNTVANLMKQAKSLATMVGKGNDPFYVKQVAEDIQLSSLVLTEEGEDGVVRSVLSEDNLQSIINAAKQTSSEVYGHTLQKDVWGFNWFYDILTGARAKAVEGLNKEHGDKMAELYKQGDYRGAAWLHFTHTLKSTVGFLFQRGIYNWAILMAQKNPISILRGFKMLSRDTNFNNPKAAQESVENYLRARAKIGRGVMGTATAMAVAPLVMGAIKIMCGDDKECQRKKMAALRADPVWGRVYRNFVNPVTQAYVDARLAKNPISGAATGFSDMFIQPVVSAGSRYYSADNIIISSIENIQKGKMEIAGRDLAGPASIFLPAKGFLNTNRAWVERMSKGAPGMIDDNWQIIIDDRKPPKGDDFWDAFWYTSLLKENK